MPDTDAPDEIELLREILTEGYLRMPNRDSPKRRERAQWIRARGLALLAAIDALSAEQCPAEVHSWSVYAPGMISPYWIRCGERGEHDEHRSKETGTTWPIGSRA